MSQNIAKNEEADFRSHYHEIVGKLWKPPIKNSKKDEEMFRDAELDNIISSNKVHE